MINQTEKMKEVLKEAREEFSRIYSAQQEVRQECLEDRRFYSIAGAQWEGKLGEQFSEKPKFEMNKIHLSVIRIISEYRNNRIDVKFISKTGEESDKLADTCAGLYRSDEQDSSSEEARDNAFEEAVGGGIGAWRLRAEYEDEYDPENEKQRIRIEPIYDADTSVYFDLDAKKYDKSDARLCFILYSMTPESFKKEYGEDPTSWPKAISNCNGFDWASPNVVFIAELYKVEEKNDKILIYKTIDGVEMTYSKKDFDEDDKLEETLNSVGTVFERERVVKTKRIRKYLMSGNSILKDYGYIAGRNIPIIPVYGKRWFIENIERCMGHVRLAKDAQRLKNMQTSKLAEISALSTVEKPIVTPTQINGHQKMWSDDNIVNNPYLLINPMMDKDGMELPAGPLAYTRVPTIPPAMAALLQLTDIDMKEILGNQQAGEEIRSNISGKAVGLIQESIGMQTAIYMTNMGKSTKRAGEVWLSMAQDIFVESKRKMKVIGTQGQIDSIELMQPVLNDKTGETENHNDLSKAIFDVTSEVGPTSTSKRNSMVESIMSMLQVTQDPEDIRVLTSMILMNMEGEGLEDSRKYYRDRLIKQGVIKPSKQEAKDLEEELENTPPNPNDEYLAAAARSEDAKAAKSRTETMLDIAKIEKTHAETDKVKSDTMETLSAIDATEERHAIDAMGALENFESKPPEL